MALPSPVMMSPPHTSLRLSRAMAAAACTRAAVAPALTACVGRSRVRCRGAARATAAAASPAPAAPHTLYTASISNFGARPKLVLAWKGVPSTQVAVDSPMALGGIKSPEYLALNPQGKMPLLRLPDGSALYESEVIVQYLLDVFAGTGPSLVPDTPAGRVRSRARPGIPRCLTPKWCIQAHANLLTRLHDVYCAPHQPAMYKEMDAAQRAASLAALAAQLDILEATLHPTGPYAAGGQLTTADAALFPTCVFWTNILPAVYGWPDVFARRPRMARWWAAMCGDAAAAAVKADIDAGLGKWRDDDRYGKLGITAQVADRSFTWAH